MNSATKLVKANTQIHRRRAMEASQRELTGPQHIGEIIPEVLSDIQGRIANQKSEVLI